ncbi:MAG: ASPIC/UnbV domain protein [Bryobacterales bacterium]|nr:ASPIC/UnbV domain protein [Bryobacterales bacterium]
MKLRAALLCCALMASGASPRFDFEDITAKAGIRFIAENGATPEKMMIETMGSGVGVLDYDRDGRLDIVFVSGGGRPGSAAAGHNRLALYRNEGNGSFTDRTEAAGLAGSFETYGMGVAIGDYDNDGMPDLLLTGFPRSVLFHNNGNGTFTDVTRSAGVENRGNWATSAGWIDYDRDGLLDLVIANYVSDFSWSEPRSCGDPAPGRRTYCHPDVYRGAGVRLFHNDAHGRFHDVTAEAGLESTQGKCLGLVLADLDGDGWPDIFVANDSVQNFLYLNERNGKFREAGLSSGVGFSEDGQAEAGMGADAAYLDVAAPALYVTHLDNELNRLYRNVGERHFRDATVEARLGAERSLSSGFGVRFADFDNSGRQQILVANGHILDNIALFHPRVAYRENLQLFSDIGEWKFRDASADAGLIFRKELVSRGLAVGDFDDDGLLDFVVSQNFGPPLLARNRSVHSGNWITLKLEGAGHSNRDAIGAEITIAAAGQRQKAQVMGASSYCSASDMRVHFGLGSARLIDQLIIRWPSGKVETFRGLPVNRSSRIVERP